MDASGAAGQLMDGRVDDAVHTDTVAVYPLVPTRSFDSALTYRLPAGSSIGPGTLVEIPVGPATRVGVVSALGVAAPDGVQLRPVGRVIDEQPILPELVRLAEWTADTCGCARTRALALVVPPRYAAHARAARVQRRQRVKMVRPRLPVSDASGLTSRQRAVIDALPREWTEVSRAIADIGTTRPTLAKLEAAGAVEIEQREPPVVAPSTRAAVVAAGEQEPVSAPDTPPTLTAEQIAAVELIGSAPDTAVLLHGITGSGKTEVYLHAIAESLAAGRGAIVLVPEIALTPQTAGRFARRFPGQVEVLHSALTPAQRAAAIDRIAHGRRRVVVGPRSAVFAPVADLGIIVVDEEHDSSYKQESEPRYDARRVAYRRAADCGARLVLASATPRVETAAGVRQVGRLVTRPAGGQLAPLQIVDLRHDGEDYPLSETAAAALDQTLRRGRKAIVLHNRRGYAPALHCDECGETIGCQQCDIALTLHGQLGTGHLECHHCGHRRAVPGQCPSCNAAALARLGAGTERLEDDLADRFGGMVLRLDSDATRSAGTLAATLDAFAQPGPGILVGTQMVAKGHDFADVELAVVVDADAGLAFPDFRAEERAFGLLMQVAGRAGRTEATRDHARVIVQTWQPEAAFISHAVAHDVDGFLARELARRRELGWPPQQRLVRVLVSSPDDSAATEWAKVTAAALREHGVGNVLGPANLVRIGGRHRKQVLIRCDSPQPTARLIRGFLGRTDAQRNRADVRVLLDVDPQAIG